MKFEEIEIKFEEYVSFDIISESKEDETVTNTTYSNEMGANDPYGEDKF